MVAVVFSMSTIATTLGSFFVTTLWSLRVVVPVSPDLE